MAKQVQVRCSQELKAEMVPFHHTFPGMRYNAGEMGPGAPSFRLIPARNQLWIYYSPPTHILTSTTATPHVFGRTISIFKTSFWHFHFHPYSQQVTVFILACMDKSIPFYCCEIPNLNSHEVSWCSCFHLCIPCTFMLSITLFASLLNWASAIAEDLSIPIIISASILWASFFSLLPERGWPTQYRVYNSPNHSPPWISLVLYPCTRFLEVLSSSQSRALQALWIVNIFLLNMH